MKDPILRFDISRYNAFVSATFTRRALLCALMVFDLPVVSAQTILERVLTASRDIDYGVILANLAENWRAPDLSLGVDQRPGIDGSIMLNVRRGLLSTDPAQINAALRPRIDVQDMSTTAIAAINGGRSVMGYAVSVGVFARPGPALGAPGSTTGDAADPMPDISVDTSGSLAAAGLGGRVFGAMTGDVGANLRNTLMTSMDGSGMAVLALNAASSGQDLTAHIETRLVDVDARIRHATTTAIGAVNTGDVTVGLTDRTQEIVAALIGG